jgi:hypothetical protein
MVWTDIVDIADRLHSGGYGESSPGVIPPWGIACGAFVQRLVSAFGHDLEK